MFEVALSFPQAKIITGSEIADIFAPSCWVSSVSQFSSKGSSLAICRITFLDKSSMKSAISMNGTQDKKLGTLKITKLTQELPRIEDLLKKSENIYTVLYQKSVYERTTPKESLNFVEYVYNVNDKQITPQSVLSSFSQYGPIISLAFTIVTDQYFCYVRFLKTKSITSVLQSNIPAIKAYNPFSKIAKPSIVKTSKKLHLMYNGEQFRDFKNDQWFRQFYSIFAPLAYGSIDDCSLDAVQHLMVKMYENLPYSLRPSFAPNSMFNNNNSVSVFDLPLASPQIHPLIIPSLPKKSEENSEKPPVPTSKTEETDNYPRKLSQAVGPQMFSSGPTFPGRTMIYGESPMDDDDMEENDSIMTDDDYDDYDDSNEISDSDYFDE